MHIDTPRLVLRPFGPDDEETVIGLFTDPGFMEWSMRGVRTPEVARQHLQEEIDNQAEHGFSKLAVIDRQDGRVLGYCGFGIADTAEGELIEFGYRLLPDARGKGFVTEAGQAVIEDAFARLALPYIQAYVNAENAASRRVLDKLGFAYERDIIVDERDWLLYRLERPGSGQP